MEAKQFHDMTFASWRKGKSGDVIQSEFKGLRNRGVNGVIPV